MGAQPSKNLMHMGLCNIDTLMNCEILRPFIFTMAIYSQ